MKAHNLIYDTKLLHACYTCDESMTYPIYILIIICGCSSNVVLQKLQESLYSIEVLP